MRSLILGALLVFSALPMLVATEFGFAQNSMNASEGEFQRAKSKYYSLITSRQTGDETEWQVCVEMFRRVSRQYPESRRASDALFTEGLLYFNMHQRFARQESLYQSLQAYEQLVKLYPNSSFADDALYNMGIIYYEDLGNKEQANKVLVQLRTNYAKSELAAQAGLLLEKIRAEKSAIQRHSAEAQQKTVNVPTAPAVNIEKTTTSQSTTNSSAIPLVDDIRYWSNPDYTRVSIYLNRSAGFTHRMLKKDPQLRTPYRLYVDVEGAKLAPGLNHEIAIKDGLLQRVRSGQYKTDVARIVLDMNSVYDYQISARSDPERIIIDVQGNQPKQNALPQAEQIIEAIAVTPTPTPTPTAVPMDLPPSVEAPMVAAIATPEPTVAPGQSSRSMLQEKTKNDLKQIPPFRTIIIDAGHGGEDPGAKGPTGLMEKDVALGIALKLRDVLASYKGIRVVMTRDTDVFVPLQQRSLIANQERGDMFISIHANASPHRSVAGISTYIFDNAKDDYSQRLESIENNSIVTGQKDEPDFLSLMFKSMSKNVFTNLSVELATFIQGAMVGNIKPRYKGVRDLGVRQAMFYVLWNTEMPSVLVETSFISNRTEEKMLRSPAYQYEVARSIAQGIDHYFQQRYAMKLSQR